MLILKSQIWEKSSSRDMDQNIFSQSDCMIFEVAMVKNGCGHSGLSTLTLAVSKEQM